MDDHPADREFHAGSAEAMALLYRLGIALSSSRDLLTTLSTLQIEILKLIQADALFVAIYNETTGIVDYPLHFEVGGPEQHSRLSKRPGLTGAVTHLGKTLYLPDITTDDLTCAYAQVDDNSLVLRTFLGIPLTVNDKTIGVLSVQSAVADAYTLAQIRLMENVAVQAALAIDKSRLLDQLKQDLEECRKMDSDLRQRESILEAVTFAAEQFLNTPDWRSRILPVLERFGKTIQASHAYLFELHTDAHGELYNSLRFEWTAPGFTSDLDDPQFQNTSVVEEGYERYYQSMRAGEPFIASLSTIDAAQREYFNSLGMKAVLEVPLFVNGEWWGTIGFDDMQYERGWSAAEVDALKIAAGILRAAIQRQKADSAVQESERIYRGAIEAADAVPYYQDYESNSYVFMGDGIHEMTGYGPGEINPDVWPKIVEETIMLGEAAGLTDREATEAVKNGRIKAWKADQKIRTRTGQIRWLADRSVELLDAQNVSHGSIGILQDITDRKLTEAGLRKRESILEAITFSAEQFLKTSNWRANMDVVLERLGIEFDATHAYLFEHHPDASGELVSSMRYEWTAPGYPSDLENPLFSGTHELRNHQDSSDHLLRNGVVFMGNTTSFPVFEKDRLEQLGVKALIELPVVVHGEWWGTIGLDDMRTEREWSPAEVDALKIAVGVLSAAIHRQQAESAVQESERIYRQAIEAAGAVPYYQDYKLQAYTFIGRGIQEMTGYAPEEVTPGLWDNLIMDMELTGELAELGKDDAIRLVREGKVRAWMCDYHIRGRDETTRWIADSAVELFGDGGLSYGSIGILQDITERKLVEANLRQREALLRALTFSAEQFLMTSNWRDSIDLVLERLGSALGVSHAYLFEKHPGENGTVVTSMSYEWTAPGSISGLGNPIFQNIQPGRDGLKRLQDLLETGEPLIGDASFLNEFEAEFIRSMGIQALLEIRVVVNGQQWGTLGFDDVSSARMWNAPEIDVLKVASSMLGAAIKRQMDETVLQKELQQRKSLIEELESKNEELERFTYTVSHDLKSPLVTISGFLGYLEQDAAAGNTERLRQDARRIHDAVAKMQRLLSELLELSRIGRTMNPPQEWLFDDLVREAIDVVHGRLDEHGIAVETEPMLYTVYGDRPRLVEVLQNLVDNAAKYMGGRPAPLIKIGQRGAENGKRVFFVQDNGIGIAPEHHERIFGLFNKLDARSEGTGVGLALVKRIIEIHGGRIWVESEPGRGATFLFTLPAQPPSDSVI